MGNGLWRYMGEYNAITKTYSAFAGNKTSPYTPDFNGRLKGLRCIVNRNTVASLINHVNIKLTCTTFNPNSIECGCQGTGLQTVPALAGGMGAQHDWAVDQPVQAGVPITMEGQNITADTPVTATIILYGYFEVA